MFVFNRLSKLSRLMVKLILLTSLMTEFWARPPFNRPGVVIHSTVQNGSFSVCDSLKAFLSHLGYVYADGRDMSSAFSALLCCLLRKGTKGLVSYQAMLWCH